MALCSLPRSNPSTSSGGTSASQVSGCCGTVRSASVRRSSTKSSGHPVPLDMNTLTALKRSPLGLDLYLWLTYRTFALRAPQRLTWRLLYSQFGAHPAKSSDNNTVQAFRYKVLRELKKIKLAWPDLNYSTAPGVLILHPSTPVIVPSDHNVHLGRRRIGRRPGAGGPGGEKRGFGCGPSWWSRTIRRFGRSGTASSSGSRRGSRGSIGSFRRSRGSSGTLYGQ